jgi:hypothetical protein
LLYLDGCSEDNVSGVVESTRSERQNGRVSLIAGFGNGSINLLLTLVQLRMHKLSVQDAGAFGCRGQEPQDKDDLQLIVKWNPVQGAIVE